MVQMPTESRSEAKRAEILRRAAEVFGRKGFHGTGMREIARGLGMAPGALYYYFESKEDLLYSCQMLALSKLLRSAQEIVARSDPASDKLRRLVRAHLAHVLDDLGGSAAHVEFHRLPAPMLAEVVARRDEYEGIVRRVLREGIDAGQFRATDVKLAALALLGALNWTVMWWTPAGGRDVTTVADRIADTFLLGLAA
jgi:AcrR family transcriptional regulator